MVGISENTISSVMLFEEPNIFWNATWIDSN